MENRFLSVRLASAHADYARPKPIPDVLVLELMEGQWALYYLNSAGKIDGCVLVDSFEAGVEQAKREFGVESTEWIEEFSN